MHLRHASMTYFHIIYPNSPFFFFLKSCFLSTKWLIVGLGPGGIFEDPFGIQTHHPITPSPHPTRKLPCPKFLCPKTQVFGWIWMWVSYVMASFLDWSPSLLAVTCGVLKGETSRQRIIFDPTYGWWQPEIRGELTSWYGSFSHDLQGFKNIPGGCLGFLNHQQYEYHLYPFISLKR